jgi:hypothetical protein
VGRFTYFPMSGVNQGQATAHWIRLGTSGGVVTFEAQSDLGGEDISTETHTFFPSVAVNSRGVVAYGYAASSPTTYAGAYVFVGTSEQSYTVKSGLAPYVRTFGGDRNRWGDYSGISVDPTDDSFWVFNEFADFGGFVLNGEDGLWGTAWARLACVVRYRPLPVFTEIVGSFSLPSTILFSGSTVDRSYPGANSGSTTKSSYHSRQNPVWFVRIKFVLSHYILWHFRTIVGSLFLIIVESSFKS